MTDLCSACSFPKVGFQGLVGLARGISARSNNNNMVLAEEGTTTLQANVSGRAGGRNRLLHYATIQTKTISYKFILRCKKPAADIRTLLSMVLCSLWS